METNDRDLIQRTLSGNKESFGILIQQYQDRLFGTLVHMLGSPEDARDVCQEAFLLAYQKLASFRHEASFYSWLFRIAYHTAVSSRRKKRPMQSLDRQREQTGIDPPDESPATNPTHPSQVRERQQLVHEALQELAPDYRDVLILKELEGLTYEEIAAVLKCPVGTIRSRIHRGREELKVKLSRALEREGE